MKEAGNYDDEPGSQRQAGFWRRLGQVAAAWLREPIGPTSRHHESVGDEPVKETVTLVSDGDYIKTLREIPHQDANVWLGDLLPRSFDEETLLLYRTSDNVCMGDIILIRYDDIDESGRPVLVGHCIRPRDSEVHDPIGEDSRAYSVDDYEVVTLDIDGLAKGGVFSLQGTRYDNGALRQLDRIYVLRRSDEHDTSGGDSRVMSGLPGKLRDCRAIVGIKFDPPSS